MRIQFAVGIVRPQPVAKGQHPVDLWTARRKNMRVHSALNVPEHPVLVPAGLADAELITGIL